MEGPHHVSNDAAMKEAEAVNRVAVSAGGSGGSKDYSKGLAQVFNDGQIVKAVKRLNNGVDSELIKDSFLREILDFARSKKWPNAGDLLDSLDVKDESLRCWQRSTFRNLEKEEEEEVKVVRVRTLRRVLQMFA